MMSRGSLNQVQKIQLDTRQQFRRRRRIQRHTGVNGCYQIYSEAAATCVNC